jgi:hypothetical protein
MLGRNHTAVGVAAFAGAVWVGGHILGLPAIDAQQAVAGTVVAAGAALAPDLDEAHSSAGRSNPISHLPIFGGHRRRTHCVLAVAAVTVTALVCQDHRDAVAVIAGTAACTGGSQISSQLRHAGAVLCVPFGDRSKPERGPSGRWCRRKANAYYLRLPTKSSSQLSGPRRRQRAGYCVVPSRRPAPTSASAPVLPDSDGRSSPLRGAPTDAAPPLRHFSPAPQPATPPTETERAAAAALVADMKAGLRRKKEALPMR